VSFFCSETDILAMMQPISVKVCTMVDLSFGQSFFIFGGDIFRDHQMWDQKRESELVFGVSKKPFDHGYLENGKSEVTCQLQLNISSARAF